jgi:hypothetical protein
VHHETVVFSLVYKKGQAAHCLPPFHQNSPPAKKSLYGVFIGPTGENLMPEMGASCRETGGKSHFG